MRKFPVVFKFKGKIYQKKISRNATVLKERRLNFEKNASSLWSMEFQNWKNTVNESKNIHWACSLLSPSVSVRSLASPAGKKEAKSKRSRSHVRIKISVVDRVIFQFKKEFSKDSVQKDWFNYFWYSLLRNDEKYVDLFEILKTIMFYVMEMRR